jgi:hypothetical protein
MEGKAEPNNSIHGVWCLPGSKPVEGGSQSMDLMDPTVSTAGAAFRYVPRPKKLQGLRVGLVENTKFNSEVLLKKVAERLKQQYGIQVAHLAHKTSAGAEVSESDIREFKVKADFVVAGVGD